MTTQHQDYCLFDKTLLGLVVSLMAFGWLMVTSASVHVSMDMYKTPFYISLKHAIFIVISVFAFLFVISFKIEVLKKNNMYLLFGALGLLVAVLFIGVNVNGSTRWIRLGFMNLQVAEVAKLFYFSFLAGYMVRQNEQIKKSGWGFVKPLVIFTILATLLLLQPDLGTVVVMFVTTLGLLFIGNARIWQFFALILAGVLSVAILIISEPYRMRRVTGFLNPWDDPFGAGYQLTNSLMAFSRGEFFGVGIGASVQKLGYLPEAHTDFIAAVIGEELGFIGVCFLVLGLCFLVWRIFTIAKKVIQQDELFEGYLCYAIGIWVAFQTFVNVGVATGLLPTKGLTLPFISYGGSSLLVYTVAMALVFRVDYERRVREHKLTASNGA